MAAGPSIHGITTAEPLMTATTVFGFAAHAASTRPSSSSASRRLRRSPPFAIAASSAASSAASGAGGSGGIGASRPTRGSSIGGNSVNRSAFVLSMYSPSSALV